MKLWTIYGPLSLWSIFFLILISDAATNNVISFLANTPDRENNIIEYQDTNLQSKCEDYTALNFLKWPDYFWFSFGFGFAFGVLIMLIIHCNMYCQIWCPKYRILRCIRRAFRTLWRRLVTCFHRFCLDAPINEYRISEQRDNEYHISEQRDNVIVQKPQRRDLYNLPPLTLPISEWSQWSQASLFKSQLSHSPSPVSQLPQLRNEPQSPQELQPLLPEILQQQIPFRPQQLLRSVSVSDGLLGISQPATTTISPTDAQDTSSTTITPTATSSRQPSTASSISVSNPDDIIYII